MRKLMRKLMSKDVLKKFFLWFCLSLIFACSSMLKVEINESNVITSAQKVGVIFRTYQQSHAFKDDIMQNYALWKSGYISKKTVLYIEGASTQVLSYAKPEMSFYQLTEKDRYLEHKSLGAVKQFSELNSDELLSIIEQEDLDLLFVYEVNASFSSQMKEYFYKTSIVGFNKNLNIVYLDHKQDKVSTSVNYVRVEEVMLNQISERLMEFMLSAGFYGK